MLDSNLKTQLKGYLERISLPVEIVASLDDSPKSGEMLALLNDIGSSSGLITIDVRRDDAQWKPSFALRAPGAEPRVRFAGLAARPSRKPLRSGVVERMRHSKSAEEG